MYEDISTQEKLGFQKKVQLKIIQRWLRQGLGEDIEGVLRGSRAYELGFSD